MTALAQHQPGSLETRSNSVSAQPGQTTSFACLTRPKRAPSQPIIQSLHLMDQAALYQGTNHAHSYSVRVPSLARLTLVVSVILAHRRTKVNETGQPQRRVITCNIEAYKRDHYWQGRRHGGRRCASAGRKHRVLQVGHEAICISRSSEVSPGKQLNQHTKNTITRLMPNSKSFPPALTFTL